MVQKDSQQTSEESDSEKFLDKIIEFKEWLNQRTYLKGDIDKIETWIKNLYSGIKYVSDQKQKAINNVIPNEVKAEFKTAISEFVNTIEAIT